MARIARVIAPGIPHHITQRGNRRQQTFFCDDDYTAYIDLMSEWCGKRSSGDSIFNIQASYIYYSPHMAQIARVIASRSDGFIPLIPAIFLVIAWKYLLVEYLLLTGSVSADILPLII